MRQTGAHRQESAIPPSPKPRAAVYYKALGHKMGLKPILGP